MSTERLKEMTRLQLSRLQEARSRTSSTPTAAALAQDVQASDTSPGCEPGRHGRWHPTGEADQGNMSVLSKLLCVMFLFPPAAASFSISHSPKETQPLCSSGVHVDTPWGSFKACIGCVLQVQPSSSPVSADILFRLRMPETYRKLKTVV